MLIVLSGLPGVGKTTLARELARVLGAVHVRIDSIEQSLRNAGVNVTSEAYLVAYAIADDNLRLGLTVVADCVNPWLLTRKEWRATAERAKAPVLEVEIVCSDVEEHKRRVESRRADIAGHVLPTWREVVDRDYHPWDGDRLVVDTAGMSRKDSVDAIVAALKK
jgi:predicted kinase